MSASYPAAVRTWTTKRNFLDIVWAEHMNSLQDEASAIQTTLGIVPQIASANPGGLKPNHGTVSNRVQSVARGEQIPFFRGSAHEYKISPNVWARPSYRADDDPYGMATGTGIKLNETGLWAITLKADWKSTTATQQHSAVRMIRMEVGGSDIGVRDVVEESAANRQALHNHVTWIETYAKNTVISMGVRTNLAGAGEQLTLHAYMRAHLVRCHNTAGEGGSLPFEDMPDERPEEHPPTTIPGGNTTPPSGGSTRQYTVIAIWSAGGTLIELLICDNTYGMFNSSPYPKFSSWSAADAYRRALWTQIMGGSRIFFDEDNVLTGSVWA